VLLLLVLLGVFTVDQALEAIGFGWFHVKLTFIIAVGWVR